MVAHYSSTDSSSQQTELGDSQSTFGDPSQSNSHGPLQRITVAPSLPQPKPAVSKVTAKIGSVKGKGKEKERLPDAGFSNEDVDAMANDFASVEIGHKATSTSKMTVSAAKILAPFGLKSKAIPVPTIPKQTAGPSKIISKPTHSSTSSTTNVAKPTRPRKAIEIDDPSIEYFQYQKCSKPPAVVYTTDPSEANDLISCLKGDVFGFDLEWPSGIKVWDRPGGPPRFEQGRTALVQICDHHTVLLIHLKGTTRNSTHT